RSKAPASDAPAVPRIDRLVLALGAGCAGAAGILYVLTAAREIVVGDSPEFVTVAFTLGVAHPPGYPVMTLLGHLFSLLPLDQPAFRVNLVSVVCGAATVGIVYLTAWRLTGERWASALMALLLGVSPGPRALRVSAVGRRASSAAQLGEHLLARRSHRALPASRLRHRPAGRRGGVPGRLTRGARSGSPRVLRSGERSTRPSRRGPSVPTHALVLLVRGGGLRAGGAGVRLVLQRQPVGRRDPVRPRAVLPPLDGDHGPTHRVWDRPPRGERGCGAARATSDRLPRHGRRRARRGRRHGGHRVCGDRSEPQQRGERLRERRPRDAGAQRDPPGRGRRVR